MGVFDSVFPVWALKREFAKRNLERVRAGAPKKRTFEATSGNRRNHDFLTTAASADSAITNHTKNIRQQVRSLEYNNGFVSGPIQRIARNVVGQGIMFQARVKADDNMASVPPGAPRIMEKEATFFNAQAERAMKSWAKMADKRLILTWPEILLVVEMALIRDGGVLVIGRDSRRRGRIVPFCLEVLEIDRLATPLEEFGNQRIRDGIEYDDEGAPSAYYVLRRHPGDTFGFPASSGDFERIPAYYSSGSKKVMHLFNPMRPEQSRGFSQLAAALGDMHDMHRYREAELMAALEAACMTGFVKSPDPAAMADAMTQSTLMADDSYQRIQEFSPGQWHYLAPGEDVQVHDPNRPNEQFNSFIEHILRGPANALDIPPEVLTQNWKDMNYSNARTVLLQFHDTCRQRQRYLIDHLCAPTWEALLDDMVFRGKVQAPSWGQRREDWLRCSWIPRGWSWVDPVKEAKGKEIDVAGGWDTVTDVCAAQGKDFEEVAETREREKAMVRELAKKYGNDMPGDTIDGN